MPSTRTALVRPTITRSGSVRAATASLIRSAASAIGTRWSMPTWCSTRRGSSWSSISIALDAGRLRHGDGAVDVDRVAPAAAGVEHHRQRADRADVDHHLDHLGQRQAGLGDALVPAERAAREVDRLEAGLGRHLRHDRIERDRRDDEVGAFDEVLELFHEVSSRRVMPDLSRAPLYRDGACSTDGMPGQARHDGVGEAGGQAQGDVRALDACGGGRARPGVCAGSRPRGRVRLRHRRRAAGQARRRRDRRRADPLGAGDRQARAGRRAGARLARRRGQDLHRASASATARRCRTSPTAEAFKRLLEGARAIAISDPAVGGSAGVLSCRSCSSGWGSPPR